MLKLTWPSLRSGPRSLTPVVSRPPLPIGFNEIVALWRNQGSDSEGRADGSVPLGRCRARASRWASAGTRSLRASGQRTRAGCAWRLFRQRSRALCCRKPSPWEICWARAAVRVWPSCYHLATSQHRRARTMVSSWVLARARSSTRPVGLRSESDILLVPGLFWFGCAFHNLFASLGPSNSGLKQTRASLALDPRCLALLRWTDMVTCD